MTFTKATKKQAKLRLGIIGPAGSGKTFTALRVAARLGGRIALLDSEHGSASKYADKFSFDQVTPADFSPTQYIEAIRAAEVGNYDVLILDGLSAAWAGTGGILQQVDDITRKSRSGNAFTTGWREATPLHNKLIDAMLGAKVHIIATLRSKTEYVMQDDGKGRKVPRKVGMAPIQRDGMEYEFDVVGELTVDNHELVITKTRCSDLDEKSFVKAGPEFADILIRWLNDGATASKLDAGAAGGSPSSPGPAQKPPASAPASPAPSEKESDMSGVQKELERREANPPQLTGAEAGQDGPHEPTPHERTRGALHEVLARRAAEKRLVRSFQGRVGRGAHDGAGREDHRHGREEVRRDDENGRR